MFQWIYLILFLITGKVGELTMALSDLVWDDMVATSIKAGYYGMENLSLIPGDVGASAVQNIGAYGVEASDLILCVWMIEI